MPTLWEILTTEKKPEIPVESKFYNPLKLRIGNSVKIDTLDLEALNFTIRSLREVKRVIEGRTFYFTDYALLARPFSGEEVSRILRLVPVETTDAVVTHDVVLFEKVGECGYDKGFHEGLAYENNQGEFQEGDAKYWRVNDLKTEQVASTALLSDEDNSGKVDETEVRRGKLTYWDFWRDTEDKAGNKIQEFYIVEMDEIGFFEFKVGKKLDPSRVVVS